LTALTLPKPSLFSAFVAVAAKTTQAEGEERVEEDS
jgi:hypothetical protein